ncbi:AAA family ATPase [Rhodococcus sp. W8901]|uniref:AAA family ATPase n=1 Tax=Rhodococcus sp. W8901 TaxID=2742603 RepID=UPI0015821722|nr:AAA family ATPase [Rhodococcus sp. W8901]QKT13751.1 AAA family ATPase [Rhodococcus sp. W8901]
MGAVRQPPARNPLSRKEGWFRLAEAPARVRPPHLSWQELSALGDADRFAYDENRRNWHSNIGPLATPQLLTAHESMWEIVDSNRQDTGHAKGAIALDAYPGLGKTTIADSFGFAYHRALLARHGTSTEEGNDRIPVCHVGLTSNTTLRTLNRMICDFYGHPAATGTAALFASRALDCILSCDTQLVIVDDVHFLNAHSKDGLAVVNHFKWLANELPVTFLYIGVDLQARGLMTEGLSASTSARAQTARRWTRLTVEPFDVSSRKGRTDWRRLLLGIEKNVILARARPGMIADELSDYLFARSTGHIGSLMTLINRGCYRAMRVGEERLTVMLLDGVKNDQASERARLALQSAMEQGLLTTRDPVTSSRKRASARRSSRTSHVSNTPS